MEESNAPQTEPKTEHAEERSAPQGTPTGLDLRAGSRIQLGYRQGRVEELRGSGKEPYEARIRWADDPRAVYVVFTTLQREYRLGHLKVL